MTKNFTMSLLVPMIIFFTFSPVWCQTYEDSVALLREKLNPETYRTEVRPLKNQSSVMWVFAHFTLMSIVGIDDLAQSFTCNGFFLFAWRDEIIAWDPDKYKGHYADIHPFPEDIWRPRVVLMNTLDKRDVFGDDMAPIIVTKNGTVIWLPGNLFSSSCELNMINYPFDEHECTIKMQAMTFISQEMRFIRASKVVDTRLFTASGEWDLRGSEITIPSNKSDLDYAEVNVSFFLRRRPYFLMFNVVLPAVFLSFLNILVFAIPADSGEKVSYGITVLLALSVFLSMVGGMLPRSSTVPKLTIYLFILLIISMLTVLDSILIVFLHNLEEKVERHQVVKRHFTRAINKVSRLRQAISPVNEATSKAGQEDVPDISNTANKKKPSPDNHVDATAGRNGHEAKGENVNRYKVIGKHIDSVSFVVFLLVWVSVTISFMVSIMCDK